MTATALNHDCSCSGIGTISFEAARQVAAGLARPIDLREEMSLEEARGRIIAAPVRASHPLPPFDQAAMDGYAAFISTDGEIHSFLPVQGITKAGDAPAALVLGTAHRIMTGAPLPSGANTVVMQEDVILRRRMIEPRQRLRPGMHIRRTGEDIAEGAVVLQRGRVIGWAEIALLAALGIEKIPVLRPLRIAVLTTGSELRGAGAPLPPGAIHDSNGPMLAALLKGASISVSLRTVADDPIAIVDALKSIGDEFDLVITTAGMSLGEGDHVRDAVGRAGGQLEVVKVAMKPGKPVGFGRLGDACFVGLPGNPLAATACALAFVRPIVRAFFGQAPAVSVTAEVAFSHVRKPGRTELLPVRLAAEHGRLIAHRAGPEGSHRLNTLVSAHAVAVVQDACAAVEIGAVLEVLPFHPLPFDS